MAGAVLHLLRGASVDPRPILAGSWRSIQRVDLKPSSTHVLEHGAVECCAFVLSGDGIAVIDGRSVPLGPNTGLAVLRGTRAELVAGADGLETLIVVVSA